MVANTATTPPAALKKIGKFEFKFPLVKFVLRVIVYEVVAEATG